MSARVPYLDVETASGDAAETLARLHDRGIRMHLLEAVANSSGSVRNFSRLGNSLIRYTALDPRLRELTIMWLASRLDAPYERLQHEPMARSVGLDDAELDALSESRLDADCFTDLDRRVLAFAVAVLERDVDDQLFSELEDDLGTEALTDLVLAVAWWGAMVPRVVDALGIEPEPAQGKGAPG